MAKEVGMMASKKDDDIVMLALMDMECKLIKNKELSVEEKISKYKVCLSMALKANSIKSEQYNWFLGEFVNHIVD